MAIIYATPSSPYLYPKPDSLTDVRSLAEPCDNRDVNLDVFNFSNMSLKNCTVSVSVDDPISNVYSEIFLKMINKGVRPIGLYVPDIDYRNNPVLNDSLLMVDPQKTLWDYGIVPGKTAKVYAKWFGV